MLAMLPFFTQQTPNHVPRLDCPSVSAETPKPKPTCSTRILAQVSPSVSAETDLQEGIGINLSLTTLGRAGA